jgi:hypothetical protein
MRLFRLNEGITHIEDLSIDKFLMTIKNIFDFYVSEKIDGANLWFGRDENGDFFTTREQKGGDKERKYHSKDYASVAAYNGFRSAHEALAKLFKETKPSKLLKPGDVYEVEIVFGKQPNVVQYSDTGVNYIVLLRPVNNTDPDTFKELADEMNGKEEVVISLIIDTTDGEHLVKEKMPNRWKFVKNISEKVSSHLISPKENEKLIQNLEDFLRDKNKVASELLEKDWSNFDVMNLKLNTVPLDVRPKLKIERDKLNDTVLDDFKLPIKRAIFKQLIDKGDFLSTKFKSKKKSDLEGFVLSDGKDQIKIVDRDLFTAINEFNYKIRNEISSNVMTDDMEAPLEARGGIFGTCKLRIANVFDVPDLARSGKAKKLFAQYIGDTPEDTASNFAKSLKIDDFIMYKTKIESILKSTKTELKEKLDKFNSEVSSYSATLKNGKKVKFSDEAKKRTLLAFAELFKELDMLLKGVRNSKDLSELLIVLYGRFIEEAKNVKESLAQSKGKVMSESLLKEISNLTEDDGGAAAAADASADTAGAESVPTPPDPGTTSSSDIATYPVRLFKGKVLKRIKRNYFPKKIKNIK